MRTEELKLQNLSSEDLLFANPNHAIIPSDSSDEDDDDEGGPPESGSDGEQAPEHVKE